MAEVEKVVGQERYNLQTEIDSGAYGKVYKATKIQGDGHTVYAVKRIEKENTQYDRLQQEIDILKIIRGGLYFTKLHEVYETPDHYNLVLDYIPNGDLFDFFIIKEFDLASLEYKLVAAEIVVAINFLHARHILHLDIKPENVLISGSGHIVIADFGHSIHLDKLATLPEIVGTNGYLPPELESDNTCSYASDFWSFGILLHIIITKEHPFEKDRGFYNDDRDSYDDSDSCTNEDTDCSDSESHDDSDTVSNGDMGSSSSSNDTSEADDEDDEFDIPPMVDSNLEPELQDLIRRLLEENPDKRLGAHPEDISELMNHSYFSGVIWEDIHKGKGYPPFITFLEILGS